MAAYVKNQLYTVPMAELQPDPTQPRKYMAPVALAELTASVRRMGIIQSAVCRQDFTVPKRTLIEIARKKQERSMLTQFRKYRDQQAKAVAKISKAATPKERKRTRAEAVVHSLDIMVNKIGDLEFPDFSEEDRAMVIDAMTSMKDTLDEAILRAVKNKKKPT